MSIELATAKASHDIARFVLADREKAWADAQELIFTGKGEGVDLNRLFPLVCEARKRVAETQKLHAEAVARDNANKPSMRTSCRLPPRL